MKIKSNKIEGSQFGLPFFFLPEYYVNINDIKQHYPDAFYNPAIIRLYRLKEYVEGWLNSRLYIHKQQFISIVCDISRLSSGFFFIWAFPFIKIPSNHVGNFRKAVIFIAVEYVF